MLPARGILDTNLEFLEVKRVTIQKKGDVRPETKKSKAKNDGMEETHVQARGVAVEHAREVQLLHLLF